ncbi:MAG: hypothetical protein PHE51_10395 [Eubacteriales bacterium]|nr:hypothetical protein [Eubacteriales bacterium]
MRILSKQFLMTTTKVILSSLDYPLSIVGSKNRSLNNYTIYGNIGGVGDLSGDKYIVPIIARGKNLWDPSKYVIRATSSPIITFENDTLSQTPIGTNQCRTIWYIATEIGKQYTIYVPNRTVATTGFFHYVTFDGTPRYDDTIYSGRTTISTNSVTITASKQYLGVMFESRTGQTASITQPLIVKGTSGLVYEPYIAPVTKNIYLDRPIGENESVNYRIDNLSPLPQFKGTTIYEMNTTIKPTGIQVEYY